MLTTALGFFGRVFPRLKRWFWKRLYDRMARDGDPQWAFMNYGFVEPGAHAPRLDAQDEPNRLAIQLYDHVVAPGEVAGKDVLEVGCGRGGGLAYLARYLRPRFLVGLDLSARGLTLCHARVPQDHVHLVCGDAQSLPFPAGRFDAVVNVESSHCYPAAAMFFSEVYRVLRPGGLLLYADLRYHGAVGLLRAQIRAPGFVVLREHDITGNVLNALELDTPRRAALIRKKLPAVIRGPFRAFAGTAGTRFYEMLARGQGAYLSFVLQKPS